jgi:hypothetical protein
MKTVDMSPAAIAARLAEVNSLNRVCDSLGRAGRSLDAASSSRSYREELHRQLQLAAVEKACATAASAVQLLVMPSISPEVCITLFTTGRDSVLEVRSFDRSVWVHWNARRGGAGFEPNPGWPRPLLAVETIHGVPLRAEDFRAEAPPEPPGLESDGLPYAFTFWRAGEPVSLERSTMAPKEALRLVEAAAGLVCGEHSKAALLALQRRWPELVIATPGRLR